MGKGSVVWELIIGFVVVLVSGEDSDEYLCKEGILFSKVDVFYSEIDTGLEYLVGQLQNLRAFKVSGFEYLLAYDGKDLSQKIFDMFLTYYFLDGATVHLI